MVFLLIKKIRLDNNLAMKKSVAAIILLLIMVIASPKPLDKIVEITNAEYLYYIPYFTQLDNSTSISYGCGTEITCTYDFKNQIKSNLHSIQAVSVVIKDCSLDEVDLYLRKLVAKKILSQQIEDIYCVYAYSPFITGAVIIDSNKINIQLAYRNGQLIIGSPVIVGSY